MSEQTLQSILDQHTDAFGLKLERAQLSSFHRYAELLRDWNTRINLTAIIDDEGIAIRHFLDSLTLLPTVEQESKRTGRQNLSLIDVGTGAGFPGLPLKIARPDIQLTLLDSLQKRLSFLDAVIADLSLSGVVTVKDRAEDAAHKSGLRERFDMATARAVAALPVLAEYVLPFVKIGGLMIAMKGQKQEEINEAGQAIRLLGGQLEAVQEFTLPGGDMNRTLVLIRKTRPTPARYPRKAGLPERRPLA